MRREKDVIFLVANDQSMATSASEYILNFILRKAGYIGTNKASVEALLFTVDEMRTLLQDPDGLEMQDSDREAIDTATRRLVAGFDADAQDFLDTLHQDISSNEKLIYYVQKKKLTVMPISKIVAKGLCQKRGYTKVWLQEPIRTYSHVDERLPERLRAAGLEVCQLSPEAERFSNFSAVRSMALFEVEGNYRREITKFWNILQPEFERLGVQLALINNGMTLLVEERPKDLTSPEVIDLNALYIAGIIDWISRDY